MQDFAIILPDIDGTILTSNKGAERIKGYKDKEILGQEFQPFLSAERQASRAATATAGAGKKRSLLLIACFFCSSLPFVSVSTFGVS